LRLVAGCILNDMVRRSLSILVVVSGIRYPGVVYAGDAPAELVEQVTALHTAKKYAEAARLADDGARREGLDAVYRVLLGGLARQNYEMSFDAGGPPEELCKAAEILRLVAPLDTPKGGASKIKAADEAERRLEQTLGPTWRTTCTSGAPVVAMDSAAATSAVEVLTAKEPETPRPPAANSQPAEDRRDHRRVRAGVGTLVPGLVLFAPMAGLLAYRAAGERELVALDAETMTRPRADDRQAATLNQRYTATTAGAVVLGVTGAALVVTGAVLLATGARERRMSVAPWGARGVGGLVLEGRF
jgi:hypothetical protein